MRFRLALPAGTGQDLEYVWLEKTGPLIVMHPGTRWPSKHWPPESFAALADTLTRERQARVVFTGSPADRPLISRIRSLMQTEGHDLSGRTNLKSLARLFFRQTQPSPPTPAHASGRGRGHPGDRRLRPHRALAHRALRPPAPGGAHRLACSPCFQRRARPRIVSPVWGQPKSWQPSGKSWIKAAPGQNHHCPAR